MFIGKVKLFLFFFGLFFIFLLTPTGTQAGCCECGPPVFSQSQMNFTYNCIQKNENTPCEVACGGSFTSPYPISGDFCDINDCPLGYVPPIEGGDCCVWINSEGVPLCLDNISANDCQYAINSSIELRSYFNERCTDVPYCSMNYVGTGNSAKSSQSSAQSADIEFKPQITIPGSIKIGNRIFTVNEGEGVKVDGSLIAKYVALMFQWFLWALGIVALAYLSFGGMQWLAAAGNPTEINKAKVTIRDALIGLALGLTSYVILFNINPGLVGFGEINVEQIDPKKLIAVEGSYEQYSSSFVGDCSSLENGAGSCNVVPVPASNFTYASHNALYLQNNNVKNDFLSWMLEFKNLAGVTAQVTSMFRTPEYQACLYATLGPGTANKPCTSPHEQGRAVDICQSCLTADQYNKLKSTALNHNFKVQNPIKGENESWHFNYTGSGVIYSLSEICPNSQCTN